MVSLVIFFIISFPGPTRTQNERRQFSIIQLILALPHHYLFAFPMCEVHAVAGSYAHVLFGYDFVVPSEGNATVVPRSVLALCAHPHQGYLLLYTFFLFAHVLRPLFFGFPALPFFFPFPSLYPLPYPTNCAMNNMVFHTPCLVTYKTVVNIISSTEHNKLGYSNGFLSLLKFFPFIPPTMPCPSHLALTADIVRTVNPSCSPPLFPPTYPCRYVYESHIKGITALAITGKYLNL